MMAADFSWDGDILRVSGSESDDFIAVQTSQLGTQVVTDDAFVSEFEGRPVDSASSIEISGGGGNDLLFSYQSPVPVSLMGEGGDDFLFSDDLSDHLDGGDGNDWVYSQDLDGVIENAFRIKGLDLNPSSLSAIPRIDENNLIELTVEVGGEVDIAGTPVDLAGMVDVGRTGIDVQLSGTVANWDDAFGIPELDLINTTLTLGAGHDFNEGNGYRVELQTSLDADGTAIDIDGAVEVTEESVSAELTGAINDWDDAFGINNLDLQDVELSVHGVVDAADNTEFDIAIAADMRFDATLIDVTGEISVAPDRIEGEFVASVENWNDALGVEGLDLTETDIEVIASSNRDDLSEFYLNLATQMEVTGRNLSVLGTVAIDDEGIGGTLTGTVDGQWAAALGIVGLNLHDTRLSVRAAKTNSGTELGFDVAAEMDLWGTTITVDGSVDVTPQGTSASLTGSIDGDWANAFGIGALQLRDTALTIGTDAANGLSISVDTDLQLFGGYIDVIGNIDLGNDGPTITFSPPVAHDLVDLLGISGFTLDDADLAITAGLGGIAVAVDTTMDMGAIDVDFTGTFAIDRDNVSASLTGRVDRWDNAFDVAGLNLEDIVLTLGAESGPAGASMFIGLGAGIHLGTTQIDVAGMIGVGSTGWDVAFRGEINSLTSHNLIDFANTLTQAGNPDAAVIPRDALGDFELKDAYINFAPKGGNAELGITDGFGIGGDFYDDGEMLAAGEFDVDLEQFYFEVALDLPQLTLGPVDLSDVVIDIRIAATDSYFKVAGTAELLGAEVHVGGEVNGDGTFMVTGTANLNIAAMSATATFTIDTSGIFFEASAQVSVVNAITGSVTQNLMGVVNDVQTVIDNAQAGVESAKSVVRRLEADLVAARAEAQREVDEIKANIASAKSVVDSIGASKNYWYKVRSSRYSAWKTAVRNTNNAAWYNYAYYKGIEATKYASYLSAAGTYASRVVAYNSALATYNAIKAAAGWALDTAGVEANPDVIRINALLTAARVGVGAAELALNEIEKINAEALQILNVVNSLHVDRITLSGKVETLGSVAVHAKVDYSFAGNSYSFAMDADTDKLIQQLAGRLASAIL
ncbi:MAG: hypothetical protein KDB00_20610 [Planctomycetales bacterium]|nr:hypothetical protein [Planctomycetales bacterium]